MQKTPTLNKFNEELENFHRGHINSKEFAQIDCFKLKGKKLRNFYQQLTLKRTRNKKNPLKKRTISVLNDIGQNQGPQREFNLRVWRSKKMRIPQRVNFQRRKKMNQDLSKITQDDQQVFANKQNLKLSFDNSLTSIFNFKSLLLQDSSAAEDNTKANSCFLTKQFSSQKLYTSSALDEGFFIQYRKNSGGKRYISLKPNLKAQYQLAPGNYQKLSQQEKKQMKQKQNIGIFQKQMTQKEAERLRRILGRNRREDWQDSRTRSRSLKRHMSKIEF